MLNFGWNSKFVAKKSEWMNIWVVIHMSANFSDPHPLYYPSSLAL